MMRLFAWCGMKASISLPSMLLRLRISSQSTAILRTANLKTAASILMNEVHLLVDRFVGRRIQTSAARHVKRARARAIHFVQKVNESEGIVFRWFEQDRARSIAEDDAGGAVGVVDDRRHHVRADHQHFLMRSAGDKLRSCLQRVDKRRTSSRNIESPDVLRAELVPAPGTRSREKTCRA